MIENFSVWDLKKNGAGGCIGYANTLEEVRQIAVKHIAKTNGNCCVVYYSFDWLNMNYGGTPKSPFVPKAL